MQKMLLGLIGHVNFVVCGQILFCLESKRIFFSGTQKCYLVLQNIKTESFRFVFMQKTFMESFDNVRVYKEYSGALHSVDSSSEFLS